MKRYKLVFYIKVNNELMINKIVYSNKIQRNSFRKWKKKMRPNNSKSIHFYTQKLWKKFCPFGINLYFYSFWIIWNGFLLSMFNCNGKTQVNLSWPILLFNKFPLHNFSNKNKEQENFYLGPIRGCSMTDNAAQQQSRQIKLFFRHVNAD